MWGGKFNLGRFKILGAFQPKIFDDKIIKFNIEDKDVRNFLCWGNQKEYKITEIQDEGQYKPNKIIPEEGPPYYMKDLMGYKDNLECGELIVENFADFHIIDGPKTGVYYCWEDTTLKFVSYENNQDIYWIEGYSVVCYFEKDTTTQPLIYLVENEKIAAATWKEENDSLSIDSKNLISCLPIYKTFTYTTPSNELFEETKELSLEVGQFFIVQDRNWTGFNLNDIIYPMDYGIENATVLDRIEKCTAQRDFIIDAAQNFKAYNCSQLDSYKNTKLTYYINPMTMKPYESNCVEYLTANGTRLTGKFIFIKKDQVYYKWIRDIAPRGRSLGTVVSIDAKSYPGNFRLVGETYARRRVDGQDEHLQFDIPLCKLSSNNTLQFEASGDPTTYNFSLKVLRSANGEMMRLTQYETTYDCCTNSTSIAPRDQLLKNTECCPNIDTSGQEQGRYIIDPAVDNCYQDWLPHRGCSWKEKGKVTIVGIEILNPPENTVFGSGIDFGNPFNGEEPSLILPDNRTAAREYAESVQSDTTDQYRNIFLVKVTYSDNSIDYVTEEDDLGVIIE